MATFPPSTVQRWTFATAWEDGPWINSSQRWDDPVPAAEAAALWIVTCAQNGGTPRVRVQPIHEVSPV